MLHLGKMASLGIVGEGCFLLSLQSFPCSHASHFLPYDSGPLQATVPLLEPRVRLPRLRFYALVFQESPPSSHQGGWNLPIFTAAIVWAPPLALVLWAGEPGLVLKPLAPLGGNLLSQYIPWILPAAHGCGTSPFQVPLYFLLVLMGVSM